MLAVGRGGRREKLGTAIEWYDFFLYSTVTGLVFAKLFFPNSDPWVGTLEAFAIYAVGFVARPVGAAVVHARQFAKELLDLRSDVILANSTPIAVAVRDTRLQDCSGTRGVSWG